MNHIQAPSESASIFFAQTVFLVSIWWIQAAKAANKIYHFCLKRVKKIASQHRNNNKEKKQPNKNKEISKLCINKLKATMGKNVNERTTQRACVCVRERLKTKKKRTES